MASWQDMITLRASQTKNGSGWDLNFDGTVDPTGLAVKGAVDDFAIKIRRQVVLVYDERPSQFWTWMMRK